MSTAVITEALSRIERKLDILLEQLATDTNVPPMNFSSNCPICKIKIEYVLDVSGAFASRKCGCHSGKTPVIIPSGDKK